MRWMLSTVPKVAPPTGNLDWPSDSSAPDMRELLGVGRGRGRPNLGVVWSWYGAEDDMRALSSKFPTLVFTLDVHNVDEAGLYPPERWYFYGGKMQKVIGEVVFADFDPAKLVPRKPA